MDPEADFRATVWRFNRLAIALRRTLKRVHVALSGPCTMYNVIYASHADEDFARARAENLAVDCVKGDAEKASPGAVEDADAALYSAQDLGWVLETIEIHVRVLMGGNDDLLLFDRDNEPILVEHIENPSCGTKTLYQNLKSFLDKAHTILEEISVSIREYHDRRMTDGAVDMSTVAAVADAATADPDAPNAPVAIDVTAATSAPVAPVVPANAELYAMCARLCENAAMLYKIALGVEHALMDLSGHFEPEGE